MLDDKLNCQPDDGVIRASQRKTSSWNSFKVKTRNQELQNMKTSEASYLCKMV